MRAMVLPKVVAFSETETPLELVELPVPEPARGEVLVKVAACGVCHTEIDEDANRALRDLKRGRVKGAKVLTIA